MSKLFRPSTIIVALVIAGIVAGGYVVWQNMDSQPSSQKTADNNSENINYDPPTQEQKNAAGTGSIKDESETNTSGKTTTSPTKKQKVDVVITTWAQKGGNMTVNGYAQGIVETGGTCTLKLTKDGATKTASRPAEPNASNTTCGESDIPTSSLSLGTWQATLSYSSATSSGVSDPVPVEVTSE